MTPSDCNTIKPRLSHLSGSVQDLVIMVVIDTATVQHSCFLIYNQMGVPFLMRNHSCG